MEYTTFYFLLLFSLSIFLLKLIHVAQSESFFNIHLQYEPGNTARYLYKRSESDYLNKDIFECSYTFICKWISGFSKIICWKDFPFSIKLLLLHCQRSKYICLFLGNLLCSNDLFVYFFINTILPFDYCSFTLS